MYLHLFRHIIREAYGRNDTVHAVVFSSFLERTNFYIPKTDPEKSLIYLRKMMAQIRIMMSAKVIPVEKTAAVHLHNSHDGREIWLNFLKVKFPGQQFKSYSLRNLPFNFTFLQRVKVILAIVASMPVYWMLLLKRRDAKQNLIALPELIDALQRLKNLTSNHTTAYYTGVYEPESNVISLYLKKQGSKVNFFVSGTPLVLHLKKMFCDTLFVSNAYQKEELPGLSKTLLCNGVEVAGPFSVNDLVYNSKEGVSNKTIAVYTSGVWFRKKNGTLVLSDFEIREKKLFEFLDRYVTDSGNKISVLVFCHPKEKSNAGDYEEAKQHYLEGMVNKAAFIFPEREAETIRNFNRAELAVVPLSNTLFERLYAGYKTIVVNNENDWFPMKRSALNNVACNTYQNFSVLVKRVLGMSEHDFFLQNGLSDYLSDRIKKEIVTIPQQ